MNPAAYGPISLRAIVTPATETPVILAAEAVALPVAVAIDPSSVSTKVAPAAAGAATGTTVQEHIAPVATSDAPDTEEGLDTEEASKVEPESKQYTKWKRRRWQCIISMDRWYHRCSVHDRVDRRGDCDFETKMS